MLARIANVQAMYNELKALDAEIEKLQEEIKTKQEVAAGNNIVGMLGDIRKQKSQAISQQNPLTDKINNGEELTKEEELTFNALEAMIQKLETKEGDLLAKTQMLKEEFKSVGLDPTLLDNSDRLKNAINSQQTLSHNSMSKEQDGISNF